MNESLHAEDVRRYCESLLALKKSDEWKQDCETFEQYAARHWSLSKTRVKLLLSFALFYQMCRDATLPLPTSPENCAPLLKLARKQWLTAWQMVVSLAGNSPVNAKHCESALAHLGIYARKRPPEHVVEAGRVRRSMKNLASIKDAESLVEKVGPRGLGKDFEAGLFNAIELDQARMAKVNGRG